ncbi:hypothetical protein ADUPG1_002155, partial [Aduncisulcus paluster]
FSAFEVLGQLDVSNNDMFTISSSAVFPDSLTSLDISGCTSIASLSSLPTDLTSLSLAGLTLTESSISLLATYTLLEVLNASDLGLTDLDLFDIASIATLTTLDVSANSLTDISLLFQLSELTSLDVSQNKLCGVTDEIFKPFFTLSDSITITTGNEPTSTAIDQDDAYCGYCSGSTPSVDPSSNVVCKEVWSG